MYINISKDTGAKDIYICCFILLVTKDGAKEIYQKNIFLYVLLIFLFKVVKISLFLVFLILSSILN